MQKACNALGDGEEESDFPFDFEFMYWETVGTLFDEFIFSLVLCLILIFTVVFVMIPDPRINLPVSLCVIASVLCAIGLFYYWGMTINLVTCCFVVMSIGLAVDY
jgi:Niemann-Pick C1 protein